MACYFSEPFFRPFFNVEFCGILRAFNCKFWGTPPAPPHVIFGCLRQDPVIDLTQREVFDLNPSEYISFYLLNKYNI